MFYFGIYLQILVGYGQVGSGPVVSGWFGLGIVWYDWLWNILQKSENFSIFLGEGTPPH